MNKHPGVCIGRAQVVEVATVREAPKRTIY